MTTQVDDRFLADATPPVCSLNIKDAFAALTKEEKLYSLHMANAAWSGARIIMTQTSAESEGIFDLIIATFSSRADPNKLANLGQIKAKSGVSVEEWDAVLAYSAQVLSNLANFKSFGGTKFLPRASAESFAAVVGASERAEVATALWDKVKDVIYDYKHDKSLLIGKPTEGHTSNYYPSNPPPSEEEVNEVQALCDAAGVSVLNTRLTKNSDGSLRLLIASASEAEWPASFPKTVKSDKLGFTLDLVGGDYAPQLAGVNKHLAEAAKWAEDSNRKAMLAKYQESFRTGSYDAHDDASRLWVKDVGPPVETYLGFIESYVDPWGGRAEWEGFVAIVDKEQSRKFSAFVDAAPEFIKDLPWGKEYEVDKFQSPDFTSLQVLSFATGGIPAGINIPNSAEIRENTGFKNVSLANILSAKAAGEVVTFIAPEERELYEKWEGKAFAVQVANHELLGHGTGKQMMRDANGKGINFDENSLVNKLTGEVVGKDDGYKPGETYGSKIGPVSSSMEECRAESVALYLASNPAILKLFELESQEDRDNLTYFTFLGMARAGVRALEFWDPSTRKHGQAHMEARLGITNHLFKHGLATLDKVHDASGKLVDASVRVDKAKVLAEGKQVMGKLLVEIQVHKSLGNAKGATAFYKALTAPSEEWIAELRPLVLAKKLPRKVFVQPNMVLKGEEEVELVEYPVTVEGVIQSFVERGL